MRHEYLELVPSAWLLGNRDSHRVQLGKNQAEVWQDMENPEDRLEHRRRYRLRSPPPLLATSVDHWGLVVERGRKDQVEPPIRHDAGYRFPHAPPWPEAIQ